MKNFSRLLLSLSLALSVPSLAALPVRFQKPWCEGWLRQVPAEIKAFREDIARDSQADTILSTFKTDKDNEKYSKSAMCFLKDLFQKSRYRNLNPEMRSRVIAYALVDWLRVPRDRDVHVLQVRDFLDAEIKSTDYSSADLERLRIAFKIVVAQRPKWRTRVGNEIAGFQAFFVILGDGLLTSIAADKFSVMAHLIPGMSFVPLPATFLFFSGYSLSKYFFANDLHKDTLEAAARFESEIVRKISERLSVSDLKKNWKASMKILVSSSSGALLHQGTLESLVQESCRIIGERPDQKREALELMRTWAADLAAVNPIDYEEVLRGFELIKRTAKLLNVSEDEFASISGKLRSASARWVGNEAAREAALRFVDGRYLARELPN